MLTLLNGILIKKIKIKQKASLLKTLTEFMCIEEEKKKNDFFYFYNCALEIFLGEIPRLVQKPQNVFRTFGIDPKTDSPT